MLKSALYWIYLAVLCAIMPFAMKFLVPSMLKSYTCCSGNEVMDLIFSKSKSLILDTFKYPLSLLSLGDNKMAELNVEIPDELEFLAKNMGKRELTELVSTALKDKSSEALLFRYADEVLKNSKMTDELAFKLGDELKRRVAKRHGLG